jgi:hypothetical protein
MATYERTIRNSWYKSEAEGLARQISPNLLHPNEGVIGPEMRVNNKIWHYTRWKNIIGEYLAPKVIVEIGVRAGWAAFSFLKNNPDAEYHGFDLNQGTEGGIVGFTDWCITKMEELGYKHNIRNNVDSQKMTDMPVKNACLYHIDGDHTHAGALHDLELCYSACGPDSFIVVDDYDYLDPVQTGVDEFMRNHPELTSYFVATTRGDMIIYRRDSEAAAEKIKALDEYL